MPQNEPQVMNISKENQEILARRAELRAQFAQTRSELESKRAQIEALDAQLIRAGHLTADVVAHW